MKFLLTFLLMINIGFAKVVSEPMTVVKMSWSKDKKAYRLTMKEHAAVYWGQKSIEPCLLESLNKQKDVVVKFDTKYLILVGCEVK